jgi:hypothetical protein
VPKIQRTLQSLSFEFSKVMKKILVLIGCISLLIAACRKDTQIDVIAPEVSSVRVNGSDSSIYLIAAGSTIQVAIEVADNDRLNEVRVVVHDAENGHVHEGNGHAGGEFRLNTGNWGKLDVLQADNTTATFNLEIPVPDSIAGQWHLVVNALDQVGNVSKDYTILLNVFNGELPVITGVTTPAADATGTVYLSPGNNLYLAGMVTDPDGIAELYTYISTFSGVVSDTISIALSGTPTAQSFPEMSFDQAQTGVYRVVIEATDTQGNRRLWDNRVIVD